MTKAINKKPTESHHGVQHLETTTRNVFGTLVTYSPRCVEASYTYPHEDSIYNFITHPERTKSFKNFSEALDWVVERLESLGFELNPKERVFYNTF